MDADGFCAGPEFPKLFDGLGDAVNFDRVFGADGEDMFCRHDA
jgi:hypothetical protein